MHILPPLYAGYIVSVRRMVMNRNLPRKITDLYPKSFMKNKYRTRERPTITLVELSINNPVVDLILIQKHRTYYFVQMDYRTRAPNERV